MKLLNHHASPYIVLLMFLATISTHSWAALPLTADALVGRDGNPSLAPLMREVTPAVVNIATRTRKERPDNPLFRDPFFRRFFDLPKRPRPREQLSAGSGVIIDAKRGYVLTNNHVIEDADEIVVRHKDGRELKAELIGRDPGTDIAVLQIKANRLTALPIGNSDNLQVGDFVVAIGNPFGLGQTVTSGIVSALGRSGLNIEGYEDFIQTDASINPGNSGGALINLRGELVGINTAIIGPNGGNVGIGFAVPSNMAQQVLAQLIDHGEVKRGRLGIVIQDITPDLVRALDLSSRRGALISEVVPGSPAAAAGLRAGDVVTAVDNQTIRNSGDLRNRIGLMRVGSRVRLTVFRQGRPLSIAARISDQSSAINSIAGGDLHPAFDGASLSDNPSNNGVLVSDIRLGSSASRYGFRANDNIIAINRRSVATVRELVQRIKTAGKVLAISIQRGRQNLFIVIQ